MNDDVWWRQRGGVCGTGAYPFLAIFLVKRFLASLTVCLSPVITFLIYM